MESANLPRNTIDGLAEFRGVIRSSRKHCRNPIRIRAKYREMHSRVIFSLALCLAFTARVTADDERPARGQAEHVIVVVWDGMRPDLVSAENTPTLFGLAKAGVFFRKHHSSYPSSTNV